MSSTLRAFFIVGAYIEEAKQMISHLQSLDYESFLARKEIKEQTINPASPMNPWEEVIQCTTNLKNCIKSLKLDIEAHKDAIRNRSGIEKFTDWCVDVGHGIGSGIKVVCGADANAEGRRMADKTHTGRGKFNTIKGLGKIKTNMGLGKINTIITDEDYANLVERDEKLINKVERLIDKYDPKE